jgi:hypothetical protein
MRKDLERRLEAIETARIRKNSCEVWIILNDSSMRGPRGQVITPQEFEAYKSRKGGTFVVLPDNGRDQPDPDDLC